MCIISGPLKEVARTKLFVAPLKAGRDKAETLLQFTVYCNAVSFLGAEHHRAVSTAAMGCMLLPFPLGKDGTAAGFEAVSLSGYRDLFKDLQKNIPMSRGLTLGVKSKSRAPVLEVKTCGSYEYSLVEELSDLDRLDSRRFPVREDVKAYLKHHYPSGYGFVACGLMPDAEYHPFGYVSPRLPNGQVFVPTRHYHPTGGQADGADHADWHHDLYVMNGVVSWNHMTTPPQLDGFRNEHQRLLTLNHVKLDRLPPQLEAFRTLEVFKLRSYNGNGDVVCTVVPDDATTAELHQWHMRHWIVMWEVRAGVLSSSRAAEYQDQGQSQDPDQDHLKLERGRGCGRNRHEERTMFGTAKSRSPVRAGGV